jgi:molybdenum storage protein
MAEFLGAKSCIFVKDEDGLYSDDPKKHPGAKFIPEISARALRDMDASDLVIERVVLDYWSAPPTCGRSRSSTG